MNLKRLFSALLCCSCLVFSGTFSSYANIATNSNADYVPTWQEAVESVKAKRASASASEADIMTMELDNENYGVMPLSSIGTVTNTVDYSFLSVYLAGTNASGQTVHIGRPVDSLGHFSFSDFKDWESYTFNRFYFRLRRGSIPSPGKYKLSLDFASDISFDYSRATGYTYAIREYNNATNPEKTLTLPFTSSSGDLYVSSFLISIGSIDTLGFGFYTNGIKDAFSGSVRICFETYLGDDLAADTFPDYSDADYQSDVTFSLGSIGDTLEEIVETISLQLEALWNQIYNYIHLPEYEKLEQIRQAIENIRLDVDVDNHDVVNKLNEQIQNDNANTQKVEKAVEKHGNFIIEGLKSLFIPDKEYFTGLFDRLNTFFSERLGFLYTPFDLLIRILQAFMTADTENAGIPFPGIIVGEWRLLEPQTVTFDFLNEFPGLQDKIYFATNTVMIGAFLFLLSRKIDEVMNR